MPAVSVPSPLPVVFDTDIGTDVDDAVALVVALGSPELRLEAVTTVYGDTRLRAGLASRFLRLAGSDAPVLAGRESTLSGRPVWWPGHEGGLHDDLAAEAVADSDAVEHLGTTSAEIIAVGPLTNVASAVRGASGGLPGSLPAGRLHLMAGEFAGDGREHNIRCDGVAAAIVLDAATPATVAGYDITTQVRLTDTDVAAFAGAGPLGTALAAEVREYWRLTERVHNCPHDALAVLAAAEVDVFDYASGTVHVEDADGDDPRTIFEAHAGGPHRVLTEVDVEGATAAIVERILNACT